MALPPVTCSSYIPSCHGDPASIAAASVHRDSIRSRDSICSMNPRYRWTLYKTLCSNQAALSAEEKTLQETIVSVILEEIHKPYGKLTEAVIPESDQEAFLQTYGSEVTTFHPCNDSHDTILLDLYLRYCPNVTYFDAPLNMTDDLLEKVLSTYSQSLLTLLLACTPITGDAFRRIKEELKLPLRNLNLIECAHFKVENLSAIREHCPHLSYDSFRLRSFDPALESQWTSDSLL